MTKFYTFEPCASSNSFEIKFNNKINTNKINFGKIVANTNIVLLLKIDDAVVSIYASGKIMLKNIKTQKAKELANILYKKLKECDAFEI